MTTFEIFIAIATTGIFSSLLALFYRFGRNQERTDNSFKSINDRFESIEKKISEIDVRKEVQQINTRIAVIESRMTSLESRINDISANVTHLMWHLQTLPQKEVREE